MPEPGGGFATRYDAVVPPAAVPGTVALGADPSLQLTDGVIRQRALLARVTTPAAILGIRVEAPAGLRAEVLLSRMADEPRPNLVEVRVGSATGLALARPERQLDLAAASRVVLDIPATDLPEGGLLLVEVLGASDRLPSDLRDRVAPRGADGIRVLEVRLTEPGSPAPATTGPRDGTPVAAGVVLLPPGTQWPVRLTGRFAVPVVPAVQPASPARPKVARAQLPPAPRVTPSKVALARATTPAVTAATPPEPRAPAEPPSATPARRFALRVLRAGVVRTPVPLQRFLVGLAALLPSGGGDGVAVDLVSGARLPVHVGRAGTGLQLRIEGEAAGPLLVLLPLRPGRRTLVGWRARWIAWRLPAGTVVGGTGLEPVTSSV